MDRSKDFFRELVKTLGMPEMRIFWISVPFLVAIFIINLVALPTNFLVVTIGGLMLIIGIIVFFYAASLARSNSAVGIERAQLKNIIVNLEDALIVYNQNFRILFFNPAAERFFGLKASSIVGREISPRDVENTARALLAQVLFPSLAPVMLSRSESGVYPQVVDLSFKDPEMDLRTTTSVISDAEGGTLGFMKIVRDRTRDAAVLRSKNEFVTVASHQLRTPITGINWAFQTLAHDETINANAHSIIMSASDSAQQLLSIVEDLLMISKIEEGRFGYHFAEFDIVEFLNKVLAQMLPEAQALGLTLYFDAPQDPLPHVYADAEKISMVIENLLDNAMRYNVKNGQITVKISQVKEHSFVEISVHDTGIGISEDSLQKLFQKFYRAENALKFQTEGSGLGLYVAKNIIRAHGGEIWVESQLNRGTIFHFTLATDMKLIPPKEVPLEY